jgi:predicted MPP superfamily phosphohydrolase
MRLAITSDIHTDINGPEVLSALVSRVKMLAPEVLVVAGDVATDPVIWAETMVALKEVAPRVVVVAGNHDIWTSPQAVEKGVDSWAKLDTLLPALAKELQIDLLDAGPVVIGNVGFVGTMGWYDLSTREHLLDVPESVYREGIMGGMRWMDHVRAVWLDKGRKQELEEVAGILLNRLDQQFKEIQAAKLVAITHVLAFAGQIHTKDHPGWKFVNAFIGSLALGERIRKDPRVVLAIAGHTHLHSDLRIGHFRALVTPLGYKREWLGASPEAAVARSLKLVEV